MVGTDLGDYPVRGRVLGIDSGDCPFGIEHRAVGLADRVDDLQKQREARDPPCEAHVFLLLIVCDLQKQG